MSPARRVPLMERFWPKVEIGNGCWLWIAARTGSGYGAIGDGFPSRRILLAHRVSYEWAFGAIPAGLELDHLCRNPACVRPDHLEAVTHKENLRRSDLVTGKRSARSHCPAGHPYDTTNTVHRNGRRHCGACQRERNANESGHC